jgi:TRAP transporter TAXI family solute receptor
MFKKMSSLMIVLSFFFVAPVNSKTMINMGVGMPGGSWYAAGGAIADIINGNVEGVVATAQSSGGAVVNIKLLGTNKLQMCFTINVIAMSASKGKRPFKEAYSNIRSLLPNMETGVLQVFTLAGSDINYVSDLKGRKVMVGPQGHGSLIRLRQIFPIMGFGFKEVKAVYLPYQQAMAALGDKKVDAVVLYMAPPALAAKQFATTRDIKLLKVKDEHRKAVMAKFPFYLDRVVPKGTYKGQTEDVRSVGTGNGVYISSEVPDEIAYKITKAIFENLGKLKAAHPSVKNISLETATEGALVDFHPGVIKYYKEKGVWTGK